MTLKTSSTRSPIVCGVDRSPHARSAARLAFLLARRLRRPLELVHVIDGPPRPSPDGGMRAVQAVLEEHLDADGSGVSLRSGSAASALAEAGRGSFLLVVGSRGEGHARPAPLGGVSGVLAGDPPCPTLVVPPTARAADEELFGRAIVCAVRDERDAAAAHAAAGLASALGQAVTLAHVIPRSPAASGGGMVAGATVPGATREDRNDAYRMLEKIARPIALNAPCTIDLEVLEGAPGPQLDRLAATEDASMLALGASERGPLAAALAGSPSRHLMRHGARPVVIYPGTRGARRVRRRDPATFATGAFAWQGRG